MQAKRWAQKRNWYVRQLKGIEGVISGQVIWPLLKDPVIITIQNKVLNEVQNLIDYIEEHHRTYEKSMSLQRNS